MRTMRNLIPGVLLTSLAWAQVSSFPGGGTGVGVGAANPVGVCAGTVSTCPVTITTLGLTSLTINTAKPDCFTISGNTPVANNGYTATGGPPYTTMTVSFASPVTAVYCNVNSNGGAGATGPAGANGTNGTNGSNGAAGAAGSNGAGYSPATSTTSITIPGTATGSFAFTTQSGLAYQANARVRATATSGNYIEGLVTYSGTTLTITADAIGGSGTYSSWTLNIAGQPGQNGSSSGGVSVFTGSTGTTQAFSATPTFNLADTGGTKSPIVFQPGTPTANVTTVTFSNKTAGARFSILWPQATSGGTAYTVTYGSDVVASTVCRISDTISASPQILTLQSFLVEQDGTTVIGTGCTSNENVERCQETAAPGTPVSGQVNWCDSTNHIPTSKNNAGTVFNPVVPASAPGAGTYETYVDSAGVQHTASAVASLTASCGLSGSTTSGAATVKETYAILSKSTNYTILTGDCGSLVQVSAAAAMTLPQAGSTGFSAGWFIRVQNTSASASVTIPTTTSTYYGGGFSGSTITLTAGQIVNLVSDGTNWDIPSNPPASGTGVSNVATGCGLTGGPITGTGTIKETYAILSKSANYTILTGDCGSLIQVSAAAAMTLPQAGSTGFNAGWFVRVQNISASASVTIPTTTSTYYGGGFSGSSITLTAGQIVNLVSDGTNWDVPTNPPGSGSGTPGGSSGNAQFNVSGAFAGWPDLNFDGSHTGTLGSSGILDLSAGTTKYVPMSAQIDNGADNDAICAVTGGTCPSGGIISGTNEVAFVKFLTMPQNYPTSLHGFTWALKFDYRGTGSGNLVTKVWACPAPNYTYSTTGSSCSSTATQLFQSSSNVITAASAGIETATIFFDVTGCGTNCIRFAEWGNAGAMRGPEQTTFANPVLRNPTMTNASGWIMYVTQTWTSGAASNWLALSEFHVTGAF